MTDNHDDSYVVGYKKPPKSGQFKKGQSGNPRGRPKRNRLTRNLRHVNDQLDRMMLSDMTFEENGKKKTLPFVMWMIKRMQRDAMRGDRAAQRQLLGWFRDNLESRNQEKLEMALYMINEGYWNHEIATEYMTHVE